MHQQMKFGRTIKAELLFIAAGTILLLFLCVSTTKAQVLIDLETGLVFAGYNDVRIPGNSGTMLSLKDDLQSETELFYRIRLNYTIHARHTISLLYAPLETKSMGSVSNDVLFQGAVFPANSEITGDYKFNSYRITYRYDIVRKPKFEFGLGFTAKIRDARIALSANGQTAEKINTGFVPIIHFRLAWNFENKFGLLFEGDALAAPQGRAEDVLFALKYALSDRLVIRAGYRILEGGADNAQVYTFSLFHYATVGLSYTFGKTTN